MTDVPNLQAQIFVFFDSLQDGGFVNARGPLPAAHRRGAICHHAACFVRLDRSVRVVPNGESERVGVGGLLYSPLTCASLGLLWDDCEPSRRAYAAPRLFALGEGS
jgi:hypothetical protein